MHLEDQLRQFKKKTSKERESKKPKARPSRANTRQTQIFTHSTGAIVEAVKRSPHSLRQNTQENTVNVAKVPLTAPDVYRLFQEKVSLRYPHAIMPKMASAKDLRRVKDDVMIYDPIQVSKMIDALVAEWDRLRMSCFPQAPDLEYPHFEYLYRYRVRLVSLISNGFISTGSQRGHTYDPENSSPIDKEMAWMLEECGYSEANQVVPQEEEIQMWGDD